MWRFLNDEFIGNSNTLDPFTYYKNDNYVVIPEDILYCSQKYIDIVLFLFLDSGNSKGVKTMIKICAPFKIRIIAFLYDYLIFLAYGILIAAVSIVLKPFFFPLFTGSPFIAEITGFIMITLPFTLYFAFSESSQGQGTWGKRKMGIRVVDNYGNRIGFRRSLVRSSMKFLPWEIAHFVVWQFTLPSGYSDVFLSSMLGGVYMICFLYVTVPLTNFRKKSVYDWIAGTEVCKNHQS